MKRLLSLFIFACIFVTSTANAAPSLIPAPPQLSANSYVLMDAYTGDVLVEHNSREELPPASLTKLMTAYITEYELAKGNISFNDQVTISEKAWRMEGSRMFVREGTQVRLEDLMRGIIIQSGNDASVAVAEHIAGGEAAFADLMNQHAKLLGMNNSHFVNSTGFPADGHYSSAYDIALLSRATIVHFPENYKMYSEKYFTYNDIRQPNRNKLLWRDDTVDGVKTGHTESAGYCLVSSALRNDMRLISVILGAGDEKSRADSSQELLEFGFRLFETQINGAEIPSCTALVNGVPFSDANTASKINAGVDIINTLSNHYGVNAPVFIDNRESVVKLIESESQIINLIVSEKDKDLRVA